MMNIKDQFRLLITRYCFSNFRQDVCCLSPMNTDLCTDQIIWNKTIIYWLKDEQWSPTLFPNDRLMKPQIVLNKETAVLTTCLQIFLTDNSEHEFHAWWILLRLFKSISTRMISRKFKQRRFEVILQFLFSMPPHLLKIWKI